MKDEYTKTTEYWNDIFDTTPIYDPSNPLPFDALENSIIWLSKDSKSTLDFGCGNGKVVLRCLSQSVQKVCGIDISQNAITVAQKVVEAHALQSKTEFICGGIESLQNIDDNEFDSVILYNVVDNLTPKDSLILIKEIHRVVSPNGKVLIKLNPLLTNEQIVEYELQKVEDNFYKEPYGIFLLNLTNEGWENIFEEYFTIENYEDILFPEHQMTNRMYYLRNK